MDLHLAYGDAAVFLGVDARFSVLDALENMHRLDSAFLKSLVVHTPSGLDLLGVGGAPGVAADRAAPAQYGGRTRSFAVRIHGPRRAALRPGRARQPRSGIEPRCRRESGTGHRPQCRTHGVGAALAVSQGQGHDGHQPHRRARPRSASATSNARSAARSRTSFPVTTAGPCTRCTRAGRWRSTTTTTCRPRSRRWRMELAGVSDKGTGRGGSTGLKGLLGLRS